MSKSEIEDKFAAALDIADDRILEVQLEKAHLQARLADLIKEECDLKNLVSELRQYLNEFYPIGQQEIELE